MPFTLGPGEAPMAPSFTGYTAPVVGGNGAPNQPLSSSTGVVQNSTIPGATTYAQAALAAKTAYQKALAGINNQRTSALQQYGYLADIDPTSGTVTNMRVDPNNPYGLFQEMLSQHASAQQQAKAAAAARGLGHGGLAAQGITADHQSFGADSSQLGQNLMAQLEGFQEQQGQAQDTMNDALYQAQLVAAENAAAAGNWSTPDESGIVIPAYGDNTADPYAQQPGPTKAAQAAAQKSILQLAKSVKPAAKQTKKNVQKRGI